MTIVRAFLAELLLLLGMAVLFLLNAATFDIDAYSEIFHLLAAKDSLAAGRFGIPVLDGHDYIIRAPLWTWVLMGHFQALGVDLGVARLPAILLALGGLVLTYLISLNLTQNRLTAGLSSLILGTSWGYFHLATLATSDILALNLHLGFILVLLRWQEQTNRRHVPQPLIRLYSVLFGCFLGLLLLTKGLDSVLLLGLIAAMYLGFTQSWGWLRRIELRTLLLPLVLIPLPWLLWVAFKTGDGLFPLKYLVSHPIERFVGNGPWSTLQPDYLFYLQRVFIDLAPYWPFLIALAVDIPMQRRFPPTLLPKLKWLGAWLVSGLLLLSLSLFKEPSLMLPCYVPAALLVGCYLGRVAELLENTPVFTNTLSLYILGLMSLAVMGTVVVFQVLPVDYPAGHWTFPGLPILTALQFQDFTIPLPEAFPLWKLWLIPGPFILVLGGALIFIQHMLRQIPQCVAALVGTSLVFLLFLKLLYLPVMHQPLAQQFAESFNRAASPSDRIVLYSLHPDAKRLLFYLKPEKREQTRIVRHPGQIQAQLQEMSSGRLYGMIHETHFFQELDYPERSLLQVYHQAKKWDSAESQELSRLFLIKLPQFQQMQARWLLFQSPPRHMLDELSVFTLPDNLDSPQAKRWTLPPAPRNIADNKRSNR